MKMQKLELKEWDKEKVQKEADKVMIKLHGMYLGFIEEKLGEDAVIECISIMAKQEADALQNIPAKEKGALKLVVNQGITQKNIHGSKDVKVEGNEDQAMVTIGKCMALENTRGFIKMGAPMTEEIFCGGCRNFYANLAKSMGFINADFIRTDDGCRYVYSKI
ncbi:MAG: hypothetical protein ACT6FE_00515 [Methanosarcinaceae archaeon]